MKYRTENINKTYNTKQTSLKTFGTNFIPRPFKNLERLKKKNNESWTNLPLLFGPPSGLLDVMWETCWWIQIQYSSEASNPGNHFSQFIPNNCVFLHLQQVLHSQLAWWEITQRRIDGFSCSGVREEHCCIKVSQNHFFFYK